MVCTPHKKKKPRSDHAASVAASPGATTASPGPRMVGGVLGSQPASSSAGPARPAQPPLQGGLRRGKSSNNLDSVPVAASKAPSIAGSVASSAGSGADRVKSPEYWMSTLTPERVWSGESIQKFVTFATNCRQKLSPIDPTKAAIHHASETHHSCLAKVLSWLCRQSPRTLSPACKGTIRCDRLSKGPPPSPQASSKRFGDGAVLLAMVVCGL